MQIAIFPSTSAHAAECAVETAILFTPTGYVRDLEAESIDNIVGEFHKTRNVLKYKIEITGESIYFHKCEDSLANR